jgi:putative aminopeptidase FrvX
VSGYEVALISHIEKQLAGMHSQRDSMGNLTLTFGTGAPHRMIAAPVDEPGYVVSRIEDDGYLRVVRLPQSGLPPHYNEMQNAQPMVVVTRDGGSRSAVVAGLSIHLQPGRVNVPDPDDVDNMYVDVGVRTKAAVLSSGVDVLSPMAAERSLVAVGMRQWAGTAIGDRFGAALLIQIAEALSHSKPDGTVTLAFVTQQWTGSRGLTRILQQFHPDELIYLGRSNKSPVQRGSSHEGELPTKQPTLGSGTVLSVSADHTSTEDASWLVSTEALRTIIAAPILMRGYGPPVVLPQHTAHLSVPVLYPLTAGETIDSRDLESLSHLLAKYLGIQIEPVRAEERSAIAYAPMPLTPKTAPSSESLLKLLTTVYGVSEQEGMTRDAVEHMLPPWAHPTTDDAGNLILHLGLSTGPGIVFMAHTDELGFRVRVIDLDGTLQLDNKGGGTTSFYWGHPALVHTASGVRGAVVSLPSNFDTAQFHFPTDFRAPASLNVGASSIDDVNHLGIKVGDSVTIQKSYHQLLDRRVSVRSLDDRVGCAALIHAAWELGEKFQRNVTFVWSTREELGLLGAVAYAEAANKAGTIPATVFAIDTFVSSDSPIESHRFADGVLGAGFVVRAIDSSNIVSWDDVKQVQSIAKAHNIAMQYGITGGGNDGAVFQRYGATDVALSWPLRNSHSPGEVMDLRDLDALSSITAALAREWRTK